MSWTSRIPELARAIDLAVKDGVNAGALLYQNAVKVGLTGGYTSGAFTTGTNVNETRRSEAERVGDDYVALVYNAQSPPYPLFWEIGHHNLFTRRFERVEVWRPALLENATAIQARIWAVVQARIQGMAA